MQIKIRKIAVYIPFHQVVGSWRVSVNVWCTSL